ncbi:M56 family metallopeptidase [Flavobacterium branchiicola]|uniref:M56 family metallopeptidase n=1 Tax=Flavobacterium branchiicola TaxID=1114875 RepID=A0ABV9PBX0_9FLAO|nr:M56 family metallopeptidase [Flavobacterium branchiicola]MBS7253755.1 M56 family metallopeptidase [Flavobacterium branchiicola]
MEALFIFIAKSSSLIAVFYFAYYFLLRKETFFNSNRYFLLAGLLTAVILPLIIYTKVVWIEPIPVSYTLPANYNHVTSFSPKIVENDTFEINWFLVSLTVYTIGFSAFLIKFAIDFYSLNNVLKGKKIKQQEDFKFIDVEDNIAPFSYFDYIVYNSSLYSETELQSILEHEKVHSDQHHTIDVIISRIFCILFWFNPVIWLYKKAILQNLEFIADNEASKKIADKKAYQYTLLKITTHETCVAITNHFYQSLIKKRIVMLNKNQSKKWNYWKYYAILPALVAFVLLFQIKTIAQEKNQPKEISKTNDSDDIYNINKNTTDQELKVIAEKLKKNHGADVAVSNIKRNSKNELIGIKVSIKKGTKEVQTIEIDDDKAIKSFGISVSTQNGIGKIGVVTDTESDKSTNYEDRVAEIASYNGSDRIAPPVPPTPPATPELEPAPVAPVMPILPKDLQLPTSPMSHMPKPPVLPRNTSDKLAMKDFDKKMAEFQKKMDAFQPKLNAYQDQVEDIMSKRELVYDKEMEKYEIAMEKFGAEMDKYGTYIDQQFGGDFEKKMEQFEKDMKVYEKNMKAHEKEMRKMEKESKKS